MSKYVITKESKPAFESFKDPVKNLQICEMFYDTIQGEGSSMGCPAVFLRLQGCTLDCVWCDTEWRKGNTFSYNDVLQKIIKHNIHNLLGLGHRLILTGGSPLKQQDALYNFLYKFEEMFHFKPVIECETECTIRPSNHILEYVDVWNCSPKLASSGMKHRARIKPDVLKFHKEVGNCSFKFVVDCEEDWQEIQADFLDKEYIRKDQVILMPLADNRKQLIDNHDTVLNMSLKHGVRFSTRMQIILDVP